nr:CBS domain-containing protein [Aneurinibacillus tyrosinisolvens]
MDSNQKLIGMVSDGDVIRFLKPNASRSYDFFAYIVTTASETLDRSVKEKLECSVSQVMKKKNLYAVSTDDPLEKAIDILSKHHFKKIPVISKNGELVGVISRGDVIRQLTNLFVLKKG